MTALGLAAQQQSDEIAELQRRLRNAEADAKRLTTAIKAVLIGTPKADGINREDDGLATLVRTMTNANSCKYATRDRVLEIARELNGALAGYELGQYPQSWRE